MEIRKLSDAPKAETIRDMVRYARNVIEEFRRAKHYKYILYNCLEVYWPSPRVGKREQKHGMNIEGRMSPGKRLTDHHDLESTTSVNAVDLISPCLASLVRSSMWWKSLTV